MKVWVIRHGESETNKAGLWTGWMDVALTEKGKQDAAMASAYLKDVSFDKIYASDLQRAYDTAAPIAKAFDLEVKTTDQLREVFAGDWQGQSFDVLEARYTQSYWTWRHDIGKGHPDGGESVANVSERVWNAVWDIVRKEQGKTVVIASHATPVRTLLCRFEGWDLSKMKEIGWVSNASISVVHVKDDQWMLVQRGIDSHLADLKTRFPANV